MAAVALWVVVFGAALALPGGLLVGGTGLLLAAFFGFLAAGVLPTIALLLAAPYPSVASPARIEELHRSHAALARGLTTTFVLLVAGGLLMLLDAVLSGFLGRSGLDRTPWATLAEILARGPQAAVVACLVLAVDRLRLMGLALREALALKRAAALEAAGREIDARGPDGEVVRQRLFPASSRHGTERSLKSPGAAAP